MEEVDSRRQPLHQPTDNRRQHGYFTVEHNAPSFGPPPCPADTNGDGFLDNGDIIGFIVLFIAGDPAADFNGDGFNDNGDIMAFLGAFLAGC